jgi:hypothetical protein
LEQGVASFLTYNGNQMKAPPPLTNMPICPDVKMKRLPFYDIQSELIKPTSLSTYIRKIFDSIGNQFLETLLDFNEIPL